MAKKSRRGSLVWALIAMMLGSVDPTWAQSTPKVQQQILPNGLKVLLVEDHSLPVVSSFVWYRVGSRNEAPGMTGLSHLVEHMLFHNVGNFRKGELGATIVRNGGQFNGFTSDDFTAFFETVHPSKLDLMLRIESDRMRKATFKQADLKEELVRIGQDIDEQSRDQQANLAREVRAAAYSQHPYRHPSIGYKDDLDNLTLAEVKAFYDRFYHPDNATVVIVGDMNATLVAPAVAKYFGGIPKAPNPIPVVRLVEPTQKAERRITIHDQGKRDLVEIAYHAPAIADADAPAMTILEKVLNAQYSGRLRKLIEAKAAYSAKSAYELKKDPGLFTISFNIAPGSMPKLLEGWDGTITSVKGQGVSETELRRARALAEFAYASENDGPYHNAFNIGFCDALHSWQLAEGWNDKLRTVTAADVQRVAKKYFAPENRVVGLLSAQATPSRQAPVKRAMNSHSRQMLVETSKSTGTGIGGTQALQLYSHVHINGYKSDERIDPILLAQQKSTTQLSAPINGALKIKTPPTPPARPAGSSPTGTHSGVSTSGAHTGASGTTSATTAASAQAPPKPVWKPLVLEATPPKVQQRVLKNGLTILVLENHLSPIMQISGAVRAGTAFEPPNKQGMSDLMAACMNNGSTKNSHLALQQIQEDLGMPPNAMLQFETNLQTINFKTRCLGRDLVTTLGLIGSCLREPLVQGAELDKAKRDCLNQFKQIDDTSTVKTERALLRSLISQTSPYYPDDLNQKAVAISNFKSSDLDDFHGANVLPEATTIVIAGDVNADLAFRLAEQTFGSWEQNTSEAKSFPPMQPNARRVVKTSIPIKDASRAFVSIGRLVDAPGDTPNYAYLMMADCMLTNHPIFSRLARRVGADPSLADNLSPEAIDSRFVLLGGAVAWALNIPVEPNIVPTIAATVQGELKKFARVAITPEEFSEVKRFLVNALPVRQFSTDADASKTILDNFVMTSKPDGFNEQVTNLRAAKLENLTKFVHTDLKPDQSSLVIAATTATLRQVHGGKSTTAPAAREAVPARETGNSSGTEAQAQN